MPIRRLDDLRDEFDRHYSRGLLDETLFQTYLAGFTFSPPDSLPEARSMIIVAVPQPKIQTTFTWDGAPARALIPPTYPERKTDSHVQDTLREILEPAGYRVAEAALPRKLLAVRSGLAAYGRNNISYIAGMGSFYGLVVVYSDLAGPKDHWQEAQMMEACENCSACRRHCPAGAISSARFLLHAERCITFHNEKPGDIPFPAEMDPDWHNCLVGCLDCQRVCPQNRECWDWVEEREDFSMEETRLLVEGVPLDQLPPATLEKLDRLGLTGFMDVLPRNLNALLAQRS